MLKGDRVWHFLPGFILVVIGLFLQQETLILLTPVVINLALFMTFWLTLFSKRPLVQVFAEAIVERYAASALSSEEIAYCRKVTQAWCGFFIFNACIALFTVWYESEQLWVLYNCCLSYVLVGAFFAIEFLYRTYRFRRYFGFPGEYLLQRFFPPKAQNAGGSL